MEYDFATAALIMAVFLLAGLVKGVVGLGLPPVVLGVLTALIGIHQAMVLVALPAFLTNIVQAVSGREGRQLCRNHWQFFLAATLAIAAGLTLALMVDRHLMALVLGGLLTIYALTGLLKFQLSVQPQWEPGYGVAMGTLNGVFTGLTGSSAVPGVFYLQSIGLSRDQLIQAMGILFTLSSVGLSLGLIWQGLLTVSAGGLSVAALVPAFAGMAIGGMIRKRISVVLFQRIFFCALLLLGTYIIFMNLGRIP
ncbi:sulfite exporter TauE/SafE family protein [Photobacterium atrarenae]|uniref:Probable membrane transporter protein n=1 Tax=Photobacterium atrarenae TaxID=865757 RepID=A0ABY5GP22_9GAMM|nr:sulfite exporter TauE/SafE family protein [Photobacterium atrarenae]UTV30663.1 sulfite exporter TauE/SafE family protein [Photobacterium atrarenae]